MKHNFVYENALKERWHEREWEAKRALFQHHPWKKYFGCVFDAVLRINNENTPTGLTVGMDMVVEGYKDWEQEPCALWGI